MISKGLYPSVFSNSGYSDSQKCSLGWEKKTNKQNPNTEMLNLASFSMVHREP